MYISAIQQRVDLAQKYSFAKYRLKITRRPLYYIMLLIVPCVLCTMLVLISFAIPPENGERIGFCATIMISVSFYLIIMADMLPEKSDTLPILGIYYTITMVEIAAALMATRDFCVKGVPFRTRATYMFQGPMQGAQTKAKEWDWMCRQIEIEEIPVKTKCRGKRHNSRGR